MRTLQEKYNGINEGRFTKDQFLRDARMEQPNLVTQYNGYDDAVKILKNRGMIQETYSTEESFKDYSDDALTDMIINSSRFEGNEESIARVKQELARRKEANLNEAKGHSFTFNYNTDPDDVEYIQRVLDNAGADAIAKAGTFDDEMIVRAFDAMGLRKARKAIEADGFEINENINEARLTNKSLTDYRYKPTNDMDKYPYEQILRGLRVELEGLNILGTPTPEEYKKALGKVLKNLEKDTIFYTNQVAGVSKKVDLHDKMVDVKKDNAVDKFNGLKKAQLKEAIKGVIKNILSEGNEFGEGEDVYEMYKEDEIDYDDENFSDPLIDGDEADDIPHPRGYEEASDEEDFDDLFEGNKSEKELRAEWEKYQATCHPEDKMSYMEWRSEQGLDESISLKDIL